MGTDHAKKTKAHGGSVPLLAMQQVLMTHTGRL